MRLPVPSRVTSSGVPASRSLALAVAAAVVAGPVLVAPGASAAELRVTWSDRSVVAGRAMTATVAPASVDGAAVVLQRRFPDVPWRVVDSTPRRTARGLVLDVPTTQYGSFSYRVVALRKRAVVSATDPVAVTVAPPYRPAGPASAHSFMTAPRWLWSSCSDPITWKLNPGPSPSGALKQVKGSFARVHAATGLDFRYRGTTDVTPKPGGAPAARADLVVGWLGKRAYTAAYGGSVGVGGASYAKGYRLANGDKVSRAARGGVVLNAGYRRNLTHGFGSGYTWGDVLMHEIGHVIGLDHVDAGTQLMNDTITRGAARWGAGDLAGFRKVGDTVGCPVVDNRRARTGPLRVAVAR